MNSKSMFGSLTEGEARELWLRMASAGQQAAGAADDTSRSESRMLRSTSRDAFDYAVSIEGAFPRLLTGLEVTVGRDWQLRLVPAGAGAR